MALARDSDLFLAEATYAEHVPADLAEVLSSAAQAGEVAARAEVKHLILTHLWPDSDPVAAEHAARRSYDGPVSVARFGLVVDVGGD